MLMHIDLKCLQTPNIDWWDTLIFHLWRIYQEGWKLNIFDRVMTHQYFVGYEPLEHVKYLYGHFAPIKHEVLCCILMSNHKHYPDSKILNFLGNDTPNDTPDELWLRTVSIHNVGVFSCCVVLLEVLHGFFLGAYNNSSVKNVENQTLCEPCPRSNQIFGYLVLDGYLKNSKRK